MTVPDPILAPESPLEDLGLSARVLGALRRDTVFGSARIGELALASARQLRMAPGIGGSALAEIRAALETAGYVRYKPLAIRPPDLNWALTLLASFLMPSGSLRLTRQHVEDARAVQSVLIRRDGQDVVFDVMLG